MFLPLPAVGLCVFCCAIRTSEGSWTLSPVYVCLPKAVNCSPDLKVRKSPLLMIF